MAGRRRAHLDGGREVAPRLLKITATVRAIVLGLRDFGGQPLVARVSMLGSNAPFLVSSAGS